MSRDPEHVAKQPNLGFPRSLAALSAVRGPRDPAQSAVRGLENQDLRGARSAGPRKQDMSSC